LILIETDHILTLEYGKANLDKSEVKMYTSEVELIDTLRAIEKDELLGKVFVAIGKLGSATSYEIARFIGIPFEKNRIIEINDKIQRLQQEDVVTISKDNFDSTNLFTSLTPKGIELFRIFKKGWYR
jgi:hypothetical protein